MRKNILILGHNDATQFIDIFNQYTRLFDKDKYEVTVAYLSGEPDEETKRRTLAEQVIFLNESKKSIRNLKISAIRKLLALCREKNFEIVICHRYKPSYIMMWVAQFHRLPALIFVMHELKTMSHLNRQLLIACLARKNMAFAGVSNAVRDDIRKHAWAIPNDRIATLYNAIDFDLIEPQLLTSEAARAALHLTDQDIVFGTIGRLAPNKDQASLIHAFSLIKPDCPKAKLVIIGDGALASPLKQQAMSCGLNDDVIFTGYLSSAHIYMKAFDCFTLSSTQEAFGRVLLEAMIAKRPLIATRANGIPEVVGDAGVVVQPKDTKALALAMKKIYHDSKEERDQAGEMAYQRAFNHFSISQFSQQFWQLPVIQAIKE
jgi:glycosyltransferase involved in cell wall biosynthesis